MRRHKQPVPLKCFMKRVGVLPASDPRASEWSPEFKPAELRTVITRVWDRGDSDRCRLCPRSECVARRVSHETDAQGHYCRTLCVVVADRPLPGRDYALYSTYWEWWRYRQTTMFDDEAPR